MWLLGLRGVAGLTYFKAAGPGSQESAPNFFKDPKELCSLVPCQAGALNSKPWLLIG